MILMLSDLSQYSRIYEINEDRNFIYLEVGAGVEWDYIVGIP